MIQQAGSKLCADQVGRQIYGLMERLFPLHRSQTGDGNRATFDIISEFIPLEVLESPSESEVLGWRLPKEWKIKDAAISFQGEKMVDYQSSNLHVLNGSQPISASMEFSELEPHLYRHLKIPESIPYRTAFFRDQWGFCVTQTQFDALKTANGPFEVEIDSEEISGSMSYAELDTNPDADESFLIWAHCCHPSLANDNLSGLAIATFLAHELLGHSTRYNYKFVFAPATIGAINWIGQNKDLDSIKGGVVLSLLGDASPFHYKASRDGDSAIDRIFQFLDESGEYSIKSIDFSPFGYDERQFSAPATNLPVGRLTRALPGEFPEYHSSHDNMELVRSEFLTDSFKILLRAIELFDANRCYQSTAGKCEPFLQPYDLYQAYGEDARNNLSHEAVMWVLNQSDGTKDLLEISQRSKNSFDDIYNATIALRKVGLLEESSPGDNK